MPVHSSIPATPSNIQHLHQLLFKFFPAISPALVHEISEKMEWQMLHAGEALFHQGGEGDGLYVLISGRLKAVVDENTPEENVVGEILRGESVGEMSLITGEKRTATIRAVRDSFVVRLNKSDFEELTAEHPQILLGLSRQVIQRLTTSIHQLRHKKSYATIAIFPVGKAAGNSFPKTLYDAVQPHSHALMLDEAVVQREFQTTADKASLTSWLSEKESLHDLVFYNTDGKDNDWTRRCIRQADKILIVVHADDDPEPTAAEQALLGDNITAGCELVVVHPPDTKNPQATHQFLEPRKIKRHYHIKEGSGKDFGRLGRIITGNANALVLAGGGARGFAHIGVYKALYEANIPIDIVAGTSIGSIISAAIAMDWHPGEVLAKTRHAFLNDKPLKDYTLPVISLLKGRKLQKITEKYFHNINIEDLWLNFFCVSSNFSTSEPMLHQRGKLYKALAASASIPGILPPVVHGNHLLIDGGVFNNFPVDIMRDLYDCNIIGVDLHSEKAYRLNYERIPGGWQYFMGKFLPFGKRYKIPGIATIMMKATLLGSKQKQVAMREDVDLYLQPPVEKFKLLEMKAFDLLVKAGYDYASGILQEEEMKGKVWQG